jgi:superfamily II DNA or RNA helicase
MIFDECHHLPTDFCRAIAEYSLAPYRLGLTATPERADGRHHELTELIGPELYRKSPEDLAGKALAEHRIERIEVSLSEAERDRYDHCIAVRNAFLRQNNIYFGSIQGWQTFIKASARSADGRRAMKAHHEAKATALGTQSKLRVLTELIERHQGDRILVFTNDNATVYRISQSFLVPAITHQTPVKERHDILTRFKAGEYTVLAASHVLNEGVDVPDARIAILLSGTGSTREYIQRLGRVLRKGNTSGKQAILYEVIAEGTTEEGTAERRRQKPATTQPDPIRQLELVADFDGLDTPKPPASPNKPNTKPNTKPHPVTPIYGTLPRQTRPDPRSTPRAADPSQSYDPTPTPKREDPRDAIYVNAEPIDPDPSP